MEGDDIAAIEQFIINKQFAEATTAIYKLLIAFREGHHFSKQIHTQKIDPELTAHYTRLANCIIDLFEEKNHIISSFLFISWSLCGKELRAIFTIGGFYNTDFMQAIFSHHWQALSQQQASQAHYEQLAFRCLLLSMLENKSGINYSIFLQLFPTATLLTILNLLSSTAVLTPEATNQREALIEFLPSITNIALPDSRSLLQVASTWMLCSYAHHPNKHHVKVYLNKMIQAYFLQNKILNHVSCKSYIKQDKKPVLLVILEWFVSWHSMGRSYGQALQSLRDKFHLVGMALQMSEIEDKNYTIFDEIILFDCYAENGSFINVDALTRELKKIVQLQPDLILFPSLGMNQVAIVLANLRLAPIQMMSFGHPASSFCDTIDYGIIEEDYSPSSPDLYHEKMILLPPESFMSQPLPQLKNFTPAVKKPSAVLKIAISSVLPKISANFIKACQMIAERSHRDISFLFFLNESELFYSQAKVTILNSLSNTQVLHRLPFAAYLDYLASCDLYLSTFPFGGANSVIDAMGVGLPVVCLQGEEIAARTDSALISRRGLPTWLIAHSEEDYITAALRLIHHDEERNNLHHTILARSKELFPEHNKNYQQQQHNFAEACWHIYQHHEVLQQSHHKHFSLHELENLSKQ